MKLPSRIVRAAKIRQRTGEDGEKNSYAKGRKKRKNDAYKKMERWAHLREEMEQ